MRMLTATSLLISLNAIEPRVARRDHPVREFYQACVAARTPPAALKRGLEGMLDSFTQRKNVTVNLTTRRQ